MLERERLLQIARLAGGDAFAQRFGAPQTADPEVEALGAFVAEQADAIARGLIEEAAASDDVTDAAGALSYLEDRLGALGIEPRTADRIRAAFREGTEAW